MTTELSWNDGTSDKLYLTYTASEGTQTISVTSDANAGGGSRSRDIVFQTTAGGTTISRILTVIQSGINSGITIITRNNTVVTSNDTAVGFPSS